MSTLISSGSSGKARRVCNAKCYNAIGPDCDCMCGGVNHGVGYMQARDNCRSMGVLWIARAKRLPSFRRKRAFVPEQAELFGDGDQWDTPPAPLSSRLILPFER
jgi:hypothetical protein